MKREYKIVFAIVACIVVVVLAFWIGGAVAGWLSLVLAAPGTAHAYKQYVKADTDQNKRQADIEQKRQTDIADINQQEQQLLDAEKQRQQAKVQETQKVVDGVETKSDIDAEVDKALDQSEQFIRDNSGFVGIRLLVAIVVLAITYICIVSPVNAAAATAKDKTRLKRLLTNLSKLQSIIRTNKIKHKKAIQRQRIDHNAIVAKLQIRIRALEQKLAIVANKPSPPTWPHLLVGAAVGAMIVGGFWVGTVVTSGSKQ